jgi:hypothetical protein
LLHRYPLTATEIACLAASAIDDHHASISDALCESALHFVQAETVEVQGRRDSKNGAVGDWPLVVNLSLKIDCGCRQFRLSAEHSETIVWVVHPTLVSWQCEMQRLRPLDARSKHPRSNVPRKVRNA